MPTRKKYRFWRKCRVYFRRLRITVWLLAFTILCSLIYLDVVGLPDFIKDRVLDNLRQRGLDLRISRLRLRWPHGIVADQVRFGRTDDSAGPVFSADEAALQFNLSALARLQLQVDGLGLLRGKLEWPDDRTNDSLSVLNVKDIESTLRLLPGDEWLLEDFRATFAGADLEFSADITNASAIREWKYPLLTQPASTNVWPERLRLAADTVRNVTFTTPPSLRLVVNGNARDISSFTARLLIEAQDVDTPWAQITGTLLSARVFAQTNANLPQAQLDFTAKTVQTKWGGATGVHAIADASIRGNRLAGAELSLDATSAQTQWGSGNKFHATISASATTNPLASSATLAWWTNATPWNLKWQTELASVRSDKLSADNVICNGTWLAPVLQMTNLQAKLGNGSINADAALDVETRKAQFKLLSDADPKSVDELLTPRTRLWLSRYSWASPPHLRGEGAVTLPSWTNRHPDWRGEVRPTVRLAGEFAVTNGSYRGVSADWARSHFTYSNMLWRLPDLQVHRPEGTAQLSHEQDDETKDYHWHVRTPIDPQAFRPLLNTNQLRGLDLFTFTQAPVVEGDIWGRLREHERIGFQARAALTNFSVRGQSADTFETEVRYTNRILEFFQPDLIRGAQHMNASGVCVDFDEERIYFTNGFCLAEPQVVANAIGPKTAHTLEPYHFGLPPVVRVEGYAPLKGSTNADLNFEVEGGPFEWSKFKVPHIAGDVHWLNNNLQLTNVQMDFYGGEGGGYANFVFEPGRPGSDFNFSLSVSNVMLQLLMSSISAHSNRLEGTFGGSLQITDANSDDWHSCNGLGQAHLRDGFIWELPIFGVLSPALDSIIPGLGSSRATEGRAGFVITNGVVYSDSLTIRSPMMRLTYDGTADFDGRVNARVEAELLRDTWLVGRILSAALGPVTKLLEYKVTGTLSRPKPEPVYFIPKLIFLPLRPFHTLEDIFSGGNKSTNSPPFSDYDLEPK